MPRKRFGNSRVSSRKLGKAPEVVSFAILTDENPDWNPTGYQYGLWDSAGRGSLKSGTAGCGWTNPGPGRASAASCSVASSPSLPQSEISWPPSSLPLRSRLMNHKRPTVENTKGA